MIQDKRCQCQHDVLLPVLHWPARMGMSSVNTAYKHGDRQLTCDTPMRMGSGSRPRLLRGSCGPPGMTLLSARGQTGSARLLICTTIRSATLGRTPSRYRERFQRCDAPIMLNGHVVQN
ncbi:hypothetical protein EVAR_6458_1 [Eumeta japonica]|uniref:Uncharacterized protein n=1 Tax=Eumeta variegata TaxID=151549 RepID=A0A4C1SQK8_EUMVA|nr:hypothetical protein EVAR_6458_1 [Eumeta japonica]